MTSRRKQSSLTKEGLQLNSIDNNGLCQVIRVYERSCRAPLKEQLPEELSRLARASRPESYIIIGIMPDYEAQQVLLTHLKSLAPEWTIRGWPPLKEEKNTGKTSVGRSKKSPKGRTTTVRGKTMQSQSSSISSATKKASSKRGNSLVSKLKQ